ncbi:hypothetical protein [Pseudomonas sp. RC2C2]|uniref:hypothetical protein n=1 Tax=Pseudomonas sp. RC2C2 TaxID=2834408 RepID=UPI001BCCD58F|nr:hypothetical protein [Pseudomonas sp. RC2C2]MBS7599889.1 hypothetical protein [Pseudomonas sp. RC2C2]
MKDLTTGQRVIVHIHSEYGPYIRISSYEDGGALEDVFDEQYHVLYWKATPEELVATGGNEYYFGRIADPVKLQELLDNIEF